MDRALDRFRSNCLPARIVYQATALLCLDNHHLLRGVQAV